MGDSLGDLTIQMAKRKRSTSSKSKTVKRFKTSGATGTGIIKNARKVGRYGDAKVPSGFNTWVNPQRIFRFVETVYLQNNMTQGANTTTVAGFSYTLSQLNNVATYQALYDQYRIVFIEHKFIPQYDQNNAGGGIVTVDSGRLATAIDFDDGNAPASVAAVTEYGSCQIVDTCKGTTRKFVPHTAEAAYSGVFTSFANKVGSWNDLGSPAIQYYGLKAAITPGLVGQTQLQIFSMSIRFHIEFRTNR